MARGDGDVIHWFDDQGNEVAEEDAVRFEIEHADGGYTQGYIGADAHR